MKQIIYNAQTKEVSEIEVIEEEILEELPQEPTLEERVAEHGVKIVTIEETVDVLYGGV